MLRNRTDHFAIAERLLMPNTYVEASGRRTEMPATHADQRMASIHSNLAKIQSVATTNMIETAKLLANLGHPVPDALLAEIMYALPLNNPEEGTSAKP